MLQLAQRWLAAAVPEGLVLVGPERTLQVELEASGARREAVVRELAAGTEPASLARAAAFTEPEAKELLDAFASSGAVTDQAAPDAGGEPSLAAAVLAAAYGSPSPPPEDGWRTAWTAGEMLAVPAGASDAVGRAALRAFVAAIAPHGRLRAYAWLATAGGPSVAGDRPARDAAAAARDRLASLHPESVHVVPLDGGEPSTAAPERLGRMGAAEPHRLGPVTWLRRLAPADSGDAGRHACLARYAVPNLSAPGTGARNAAGRGATVEEAQLVARAEAAERYAMGDVAPHDLHRAPASGLDRVVEPHELRSGNERQRQTDPDRFDPAAPYLWILGRSADGAEAWLMAESVFQPFSDPEHRERVTAATSSGTAAHTDRSGAERRAVAELVERDAFAWTWVQRVAREHIAEDGLSEDTRALFAAVRADGWEPVLVNLTLETLPVVMCVMHRPGGLSLGAAAGPDPGEAVERAVSEASMLRWIWRQYGEADIEAEAVEQPREHLRYHQRADRVAAASFLWDSPERIELGDVHVPDAPADELLASGGLGQPLYVDLDSPAVAPFRVVRALVPGLVPISFGWDREPLGMPRLAQPKRLPGGRVVGRELDLSRAGPLPPHPFA